jgi:amino acid transporter
VADSTQHHIKTLGVRDMTLFTVSAILLLDTLAASASIGVSSITWWMLLGFFFMIPYAMISAELGTTFPEQGGIYAWIRDTFGKRWSTRLSWLYWLNNVLWISSVLVLFSGIFAQMFFPDMSLAMKIGISIAVTWIVVLITILSLRIGKWIPNIGALIKLVAFLSLIAGGVAYANRDGVTLANEFSLYDFVPEWGSSLQYISTIIYGMLGFELMSSAAAEMKNPRRDIPRAVFWSALTVFLMYILGTFAILAAVPVGEIDLVEGLVDTFRILFGESQLGHAAAVALGACVLFTFFSNSVTWSIGCNRSAAEAAIDHELPSFLGISHKKYGTPLGAAIALGVCMTLVLIGFGAMAGSNEELFWKLFAASAVIYMLPYIGACLAFYRARTMYPDRPRPYKAPGGNGVALLMTAVCSSLLGMSIVLFMYVPGEGIDWLIVIVSIASIAIGEVAIRYAERERVRKAHSA